MLVVTPSSTLGEAIQNSLEETKLYRIHVVHNKSTAIVRADEVGVPLAILDFRGNSKPCLKTTRNVPNVMVGWNRDSFRISRTVDPSPAGGMPVRHGSPYLVASRDCGILKAFPSPHSVVGVVASWSFMRTPVSNPVRRAAAGEPTNRTHSISFLTASSLPFHRSMTPFCSTWIESPGRRMMFLWARLVKSRQYCLPSR